MAGQEQPHSAAYMGPQRDLFWNRDHIELVGLRLGLASVRSVLDVGCGQGHWGRLLDSVTAPDATTVGIDLEREWVAEAVRQAGLAGLTDRFRYEHGQADALPFADATFDLVTCQTLLIHVPDPGAVIAEMRRVVRPGGVVLAAEPNNRAGLLVGIVPATDGSPEAVADRVRFYLTCERGKIALGQGDNSVGDLLPGFFAEAGLESIECFLADKTWPLVPPYATEEQRTVRTLTLDEATAGTWSGWTREEALALYRAGGGDDTRFDAEWEQRLREVRAEAEALERQTFHSAGGTIHYLVAGRRPA